MWLLIKMNQAIKFYIFDLIFYSLLELPATYDVEYRKSNYILLLKRYPETKHNHVFLDVLSSDIYF